MANLERIYTIPLGDAYLRVRNKRAKRAIAFIQAFALRHMKATGVRISEGVNSLVFRDGMGKPPRRIKVRIVKGEEGLARVWLIGEEEKVKAELDKKKKESEETKKKSEEKKKAEDEAKKKADEAKKQEGRQPATQKDAAKAAAPTPAPVQKQAAPSTKPSVPISAAPSQKPATPPAAPSAVQTAKK